MITTEAEAFEAILAHHAVLNDEVKRRSGAIVGTSENGEPGKEVIGSLVSYLDSEVIPHALAEESSIYQAAENAGLGELIEEMKAEHKLLIAEKMALEGSKTAQTAAEHSLRFAELFSAHVTKENELILPSLLESVNIDLTTVLSEMHELFRAAQDSAASSPDQSDSTAGLLQLLQRATEELARMGGKDAAAKIMASAWAVLEPEHADLASKATVALHRLLDLRSSEPVTLSSTRGARIEHELDVRRLAPAQRHAEIFAAYRALSPGNGFLLVNDHDPKPLQYQFEAEYTGQFTWDYLESGPKVWRVRIGRPA